MDAPLPISRRRWLLALAAALAGCGRKGRRRGRQVQAGATVLALGDSLTYGTGALSQDSYPAVLARLTGWQVVNAGVPGEVSAQARERLPGLLLEHRPQLVLLGIGGNDLLRRTGVAALRDNLLALGAAVLAAPAQLLLIAVPRPTLAAAVIGRLDDHPLYAEVAQQLGVPLYEGGWAAVLADASLRSDAIHANAEGYRRFAEGLFGAARSAGLAA